MKVIWETDDIKEGWIVATSAHGERWIIGFDATVATEADGPRWCLISLRDGMVQARHSRARLAMHLTNSEMRPFVLFASDAGARAALSALRDLAGGE